MRFTLSALLLGFLLDLALGDPRWLYHPIRLVGHLITGTERVLRGLFPETKKGELAAGVFFGLFVVAVSTAVPFLILLVAAKIHLWLFFALCVVWDYQLLATKALKVDSMKVYTNKRNLGIHASRICGLHHSTGEYILFLDQDDVIEPRYFLSQFQAIGDSDAVICNATQNSRSRYSDAEFNNIIN